MKDFLRKDYGPFSGAIWIVVIVGGVGLGLVMRRFMVPKGGDGVPVGADTNPVAPGYGVETNAPAFQGYGGGSLYNQGEIVNDVLEAIEVQKPPVATTDPVVKPTPTPAPLPLPAPKPAPVTPKPAPPAAKPPAATTVTYVVQKGDSLNKIGAKHGVTWKQIYDLNRAIIGSNPDLIKPGQRLQIPKG